MRHLGRLALVITFVSVIVLERECALAQSGTDDREAQALFEAGRQAFEAGRFQVALTRWQEAHALSGRPQLLYNIGLAHDRLRQDVAAVDAFQAFLNALPDDPRGPEVRGRIAAITAARVPSPEETAKAAAPSATILEPDRSQSTALVEDSESDGAWYSHWLTWVGVAGIAAASVVIVAFASTPDSKTERAEPTSGLTVQALGR